MKHHQTPPYNTGKVRIGSAYVPPVRADYSAEERQMQNILLGAASRTVFHRVLFWLYAAAVVGLMFVFNSWSAA